MPKSSRTFSSFAAFLTCVAAGAAAGAAAAFAGRGNTCADRTAASEIPGLRAEIARLDERLATAETRLEDQAQRLSELPSTTQIVAAMEQTLSRAMSGLDDRLLSHARSIDTLKITVGQTEGLLERVLESLDSLHAANEGIPEEVLLRKLPA